MLYKQKEVGIIQVQRRGLYYQISCRVSVPTGSYYYLHAVSKNEDVDLGLCVPMYNDFGLSTNQPMKNFPSDEYSFVLEKKMSDDCIHIETDNPFNHLHRLKFGQFIVHNGFAYVNFSDRRELL